MIVFNCDIFTMLVLLIVLTVGSYVHCVELYSLMLFLDVEHPSG